MPSPIEVEGLRKNYGPLAAVKGIDFAVHTGEVFGLLGPNGAGKTTTVEILEGLRARSGGHVSVLGFDPEVQPLAVKDRVGICLQSTNLQEKIRVREAVDLFCSFYSRTVDTRKLLERLQLWEKREAFYAKLSGGQKQRLALALALLNDPQVLFLDEPSAGLDPQARHEIHDLVQQLRAEQRTILLTTHYIEEAERLCDRVAIIDEGRIAALGTPREIQQRARAASRIELETARPLTGDPPASLAAVDSLTLDSRRTRITAASGNPARAVVEIVRWLDAQGVELEDIRIARPSLEDAFIELTGKSLRE